MASAAWFFSTLAQSSAAIVSFIVAFSTVHYQLEKREVNKRNKEFRQDLTEFYDKYNNVVGFLYNYLAIQGDESFERIYTDDLELESYFLKGQYDVEKDLKKTNTAFVWSLIYRIDCTLAEIDSNRNEGNKGLISEQHINNLIDCSANLSNIADVRLANAIARYNNEEDSIADDWVRELTEESVATPDTEVIDTSPENVRDLLDEPETFSDNQIERMDTAYIKNWIEEYVDMNNPSIHLQDTEINGRNLYSLSLLFNELNRDAIDIKSSSKGTVITEGTSYHLDNKRIAFLLIVGVFLPIFLLITLPSRLGIPLLSGWYLFTIEFALLIPTAYFTVKLFHDMAGRMSY